MSTSHILRYHNHESTKIESDFPSSILPPVFDVTTESNFQQKNLGRFHDRGFKMSDRNGARLLKISRELIPRNSIIAGVCYVDDLIVIGDTARIIELFRTGPQFSK